MNANPVTQNRCAVLRDGHFKLRGEGAGFVALNVELSICQSPPIGSFTSTVIGTSL